MGLLLALQSRIPDRWFLRRLLPSALFVAVAYLVAGLGQSRWYDAGLAARRLERYLGAAGGAPAHTTAALLLYAIAVTACAFAVPVSAQVVSSLAAGAWPWWLAPLSERVRERRVRRWRSPDDLRDDALRSRGRGKVLRAARLEARAAATARIAPKTPTWTGDRLRSAADRVRELRGLDVETSWVDLLLDLSESSRAALLEARDGYDGACEATVWSLAYLALGVCWWPAAVVGALAWLASWRWLRQAGDVLGSTTEAVARAQDA
ncbi:hypothetical protein [Streptomyces sp. NBC_00525]|uniref:hypothetical protein n=1 Tax=Streptomyces sp. NBC_00525 TaxID=2903660 RepID=UPI002E80C10B|nr:hypothetical protein [Streptomyces sp. NBC_00525]WUC93351.1 hypothetical protein OG710_06875 [Streptomyces sp. NBC_00525]